MIAPSLAAERHEDFDSRPLIPPMVDLERAAYDTRSILHQPQAETSVILAGSAEPRAVVLDFKKQSGVGAAQRDADPRAGAMPQRIADRFLSDSIKMIGTEIIDHTFLERRIDVEIYRERGVGIRYEPPQRATERPPDDPQRRQPPREVAGEHYDPVDVSDNRVYLAPHLRSVSFLGRRRSLKDHGDADEFLAEPVVNLG